MPFLAGPISWRGSATRGVFTPTRGPCPVGQENADSSPPSSELEFKFHPWLAGWCSTCFPTSQLSFPLSSLEETWYLISSILAENRGPSWRYIHRQLNKGAVGMRKPAKNEGHPRSSRGRTRGGAAAGNWWELWSRRAPDPHCDHRVKGTGAAKPQSSKEGWGKPRPSLTLLPPDLLLLPPLPSPTRGWKARELTTLAWWASQGTEQSREQIWGQKETDWLPKALYWPPKMSTSSSPKPVNRLSSLKKDTLP